MVMSALRYDELINLVLVDRIPPCRSFRDHHLCGLWPFSDWNFDNRGDHIMFIVSIMFKRPFFFLSFFYFSKLTDCRRTKFEEAVLKLRK